MNKVYEPSMSRETLQLYMSYFRKISYNRFRWWRWIEGNPPAPSKVPLLYKIKNGDFDSFIFMIQAVYCEHLLNDLWFECKGNVAKYNEESIKLNLRRQKLLEDYWKSEDKKLKSLVVHLAKHFKIEKEKVEDYMGTFDGTTEELYISIEKNLIKFKSSLAQFINQL